MRNQQQNIIKSSGEKVKFSFSKLRRSLRKSGATEAMVSSILDDIRDELYQGISTKEIYNRAYALLKNFDGGYASRYKLKKAIYELGPSGFPFEKLVAQILIDLKYDVKLNLILQGKCVNHEVDLMATKDSKRHLIECKFHTEEGKHCDVKIPLYIDARFRDIYAVEKNKNEGKGWVVTNTRFTSDAITYGNCAGLYLLSWDYPVNNSLKVLIDQAGFYPVTTSTLLSSAEKQFLIDKGVIMGRQLIEKPFLLDHQGISAKRKERILAEFQILCKKSKHHGKQA